jgi:hypothetical protein
MESDEVGEYRDKSVVPVRTKPKYFSLQISKINLVTAKIQNNKTESGLFLMS